MPNDSSLKNLLSAFFCAGMIIPGREFIITEDGKYAVARQLLGTSRSSEALRRALKKIEGEIYITEAEQLLNAPPEIESSLKYAGFDPFIIIRLDVFEGMPEDVQANIFKDAEEIRKTIPVAAQKQKIELKKILNQQYPMAFNFTTGTTQPIIKNKDVTS